jgi:predicted neuraminidase
MTLTKTSLPNNNSAIDMVKLESGELILAFNPTGLGKDGKQSVNQSIRKLRNMDAIKLDKKSCEQLFRVIRKLPLSHQGDNNLYPLWGPRTPLSLAVLKDEGESWQLVMDLENQEGEYSYPAIIQDKNRRIHIVYTYNRLAIKHVCLEENDILKFNSHK